MAIVTSGTGKDSAGGFGKVTGFLKVKDVIVNPNKEELEAYGVTWKEPVYEYEDIDRGKASIVEFYFKVDESNFEKEDNAPKDTILSTRMYLYPQFRTAQDGKLQYMNAFGDFTFAVDVESVPSWFNKEGIRPAYVGEEQLMSFIKAWGDVRKGDMCTLDTMDKITRGDVSEIKTLEKIWDTHKLKVLVGLQDRGEGKFVQVVYSRDYWRVFTTKLPIKENGTTSLVEYWKAFDSYLAQEYKGFDKVDKLTYIPKVWTPDELKSVTPSPNTPTGTSSTSSSNLF